MEQISLIFFLVLKFCTIVSVVLAAKIMLECFTFFFQVFELSCPVEVCQIMMFSAASQIIIVIS